MKDKTLFSIITFIICTVVILFPIKVKAVVLPPSIPATDTAMWAEVLSTFDNLYMASRGFKLPQTEGNTANEIFNRFTGLKPDGTTTYVNYMDPSTLNPISNPFNNWTVQNLKDTTVQKFPYNFYYQDGTVVPDDDVTIAVFDDSLHKLLVGISTSTGETLKYGEDFQHSRNCCDVEKQGLLDRQTNVLDAFSDSTGSCAWYNQDTITPQVKTYLDTLPNCCYGETTVYGVTIGFIAPISNAVGYCLAQNSSANTPTFVISEAGMQSFECWASDNTYLAVKSASTLNGYKYDYRYPPNGLAVSMNMWQNLKFEVPTDNQLNYDLSDVTIFSPSEKFVFEGDTNNIYEGDKITNNDFDYNFRINNRYDQREFTTINNYPITINPSDTNNYDFSPTYNFYNDYHTIINNPSEGDSIGSIEDPSLPDNIPVLDNLQKRFPFSIPFDIYNLFKGLSANRETPSINTTVYIPVADYNWHIEYDLHEWDNIAELFRTLFLISFIISLAWWSYDHFFGS